VRGRAPPFSTHTLLRVTPSAALQHTAPSAPSVPLARPPSARSEFPLRAAARRRRPLPLVRSPLSAVRAGAPRDRSNFSCALPAGGRDAFAPAASRGMIRVGPHWGAAVGATSDPGGRAASMGVDPAALPGRSVPAAAAMAGLGGPGGAALVHRGLYAPSLSERGGAGALDQTGLCL